MSVDGTLAAALLHDHAETSADGGAVAAGDDEPNADPVVAEAGVFVERIVEGVAHCKRGYTARLHGDREARTPEIPPRPSDTLAGDWAELEAAHKAQRAAIAALTDEEVTPVVADFLANTIRHDIWHAGQIAVARRLWRMRGEG